MAIIPNDEKVFMVSKSTNTTYSGSTALKAMQEWYTMQDVKDSVGAGLPYKSYVAIVSQTGTSAPVVNTLLGNTLGGTVSFAYSTTGEYDITIGGLFTNNKTVIIAGPGRRTTASAILGTTIVSTSLIKLYSYNDAGLATNGLISLVPIEIRVYN
jgi:hypothetical protein